ncbi:pentatricopeptide repeat-containing protein mitochondrial [Dorcoceras hygrometricum]|uniref:Pentatricopeptide repeat-containing protein mitochondrial n=1 Tax=Dorcoceras hygrometricum TaxID=472368 RepID=A0A2Z7BZU6_9LAMI|nr:pentatricopeptide repeat-containing protein mitochondrial [Dorcoceras hygrometricum]
MADSSFSVAGKPQMREYEEFKESKSHFSDSEFERDDHENELYVDGKISGVANEVDRVCKVMEETFAFDPNMETVLDGCGVDLSHELVLRVLERFKHARKPAYRFFCWACERRGFAHNLRNYNMMLSILGKSRQFETMVSVLEEMRGKDLLTTETFTICVKAFAAAKEVKKAVGILDLMKKFKFKVDAEVINCLLDALGRAKLGKEAQVLFEKLEHRFTPNLCTYTVLLHGWCRVNNLMEAGRMWNRMIDDGFKPDIVAHNIMLEGLLRNKKMSHAMELFGVMKSRGPYPNVRSYTVFIKDLCKHGNMQEAMAYLDEMVDSGCEPDAAVYTCLIMGSGNRKKMNMVYRLLKQMQEKGYPPDGRTYNVLIKMMTSQHMPDDAAYIYKKMIQGNIQPSIHTYNMMMKSYFASRNYEMGCRVWEEMKKKGCCPDENSYIILIRGLKRQGRSTEACRYIEEMIGKGMKAPELDHKFAADISRADRPDIWRCLLRR